MNKPLFSRWDTWQVMSTGKDQDVKKFLVRIYKNYCLPRQVSFVDLAPYSQILHLIVSLLVKILWGSLLGESYAQNTPMAAWILEDRHCLYLY